MNGQLMFCGHRAEGKTDDGKPVCELCWDFTWRSEKPVITFHDHLKSASRGLNKLDDSMAENGDISDMERHKKTAEQLSQIMTTLEAAWEILLRDYPRNQAE